MKTKILSVTLCVMTIFMVACTNNDEYTKVIPKYASMVISADLQQMAEKGEIEAGDGRMLVEGFSKSIKVEMTQKELEVFDKVLSNPKEYGLDLGKKVYYFVTPEFEYNAILSSVSDYDKLKKLTDTFVSQHICEPFVEKDGICSSVLNEESIIIYNDKAFLLLSTMKDVSLDKMKEKAEEWLSNETSESYTITEEFSRMESSDVDIKLAVSLDCMSGDQVRTIFKKTLPLGIDLKDIGYLFFVNFEKGQLKVDIENLCKTDETKAQFDKYKNVIAGKLKGRFLNKMVGSSLFYASASFDGSELCKMIVENKTLKSSLDSLEIPVDLKNVLSSVNGEFAVAVAPDGLLPQIAIYAEVDKDDILKEVEVYKMALDIANIRYGIDDGVFYMTNMDTSKSDESLADSKFGIDSKGKIMYFTVDFKALSDMLGLVDKDVVIVKIISEYLKSVTVYKDDILSSRFIYTSTDSKTNVLKQIIDLVRKEL